MKQLLYHLSNFFFPDICPVCRQILALPGEILCLQCELNMPYTGYISDPDNPVARLFWGRTRVEGATSLFRFEKGSAYQPLLHALKYRGKKEIGLYLGKMLGNEIAGSTFASCKYLVPVHLNEKKLRKRGYNQSEIIAMGVSSVTGLEINNQLLIKSLNTGTQTKRSRFERYENVKQVFQLKKIPELEEESGILLIDDVVTTGATLEACTEAILSYLPVKVYIATVACV